MIPAHASLDSKVGAAPGFAEGRIMRQAPGGQRSYPGRVNSQGRARVIQLRPAPAPVATLREPALREPLWRHIVGDVLRRERLAQERRLRDVADEARISMPYLSEIERGRKEASSEVLAAAAHALGLSLADLLTLAQRELTRADDEGQAAIPNRDSGPAEQPGTAKASLASRRTELSLAA
jgi:transcriptional regulator with XRE-family HTH domain